MTETSNAESTQALQRTANQTAAADQVEAASRAFALTRDRTADFIRKHPVLCIGGALTVGYLLGRVAARRWLR